MSKQIVISGNRILAYGEDCFLAMGGTVICPDTGRVYQNATVATVDVLPADIDSMGYEYHAGDFIPCAPFGIGTGNLAVFCGEDCKALKDSGIPISDLTITYASSYPGNNSMTRTIALDFKPEIVFISSKNGTNYPYSLFLTPSFGFSWSCTPNTNGGTFDCEMYQNEAGGWIVRWGDNTGGTTALVRPEQVCNASGVTYTVVAIGLRGE